MAYIYFWSKSSSPDARHLSNFAPAPLEYRGVAFPSVENAFQAAKYLRSTRPEVFETLARMTPAAAKTAGGKAGMKRVGATLDVAAWDGDSPGVMRELIALRVASDERFREQLAVARAHNTHLLHFERPPRTGLAVWGGHFPQRSRALADFRGRNTLGRIMMETAL